MKNRIEVAKLNLRKAENAKIAAETQLAQAESQQKEIITQMEAAGVTPETISTVIGQLEAQIQADLTTVEQLIPVV